jgi:hypothetical protein
LATVSGVALFFLYFGINMIQKDDPGPGIFMLLLGGGVVAAALIGRTVTAWIRGQHAARRMAYGVTNRRVLIVRGEEVDWVGPRQLEDVVLRGGNVVVTRRQSNIEGLWNAEAPSFVDENTPGQGLIDVANSARREMTLAGLRDPVHVMNLIQTLTHPLAS